MFARCTWTKWLIKRLLSVPVLTKKTVDIQNLMLAPKIANVMTMPHVQLTVNASVMTVSMATEKLAPKRVSKGRTVSD